MIGSLRHRVQVQSPSESPDAYGEPVKSWSSQATRWASIEPLQGREFWQASQVQSEVTHRIKMRNVDGIDSTWRILFGSRAFAIKSVIDPQERGRLTEIMAVES